jgi:hypothetical protein
MPIDLPASLRSDVKLLVREGEAERARAESARADADAHDKKAAAIHATMGWRERWLWVWLSRLLGGDSRKVGEYTAARSLQSEFNARADGHMDKFNDCESRAEDALDKHLRATDDDYKALVIPYDASLAMKKTVRAFMSRIDNALREIDQAQNAEMMEMVTPKKNKGMKTAMSAMSYMETAQAKEAIAAVNRAAPDFQKAAADYTRELDGFRMPRVNTDMMNTTDFVFDIALGGMDFTSFFALNALQKSEDGMKNAKQKLAQAGAVVDENLAKATQARGEYLMSARKLCV